MKKDKKNIDGNIEQLMWDLKNLQILQNNQEKSLDKSFAHLVKINLPEWENSLEKLDVIEMAPQFTNKSPNPSGSRDYGYCNCQFI